MKQTITILFFILFQTLVFSQNKKLTVGIAGAPTYYNVKSAEGFNHEYTKKLSYRVGLDLGFHLGKRSTISTGAYYSTIGYKVVYKYIFIQPNDPYIPRNADITANYLEIPLTYNFNVVAKPKLEFYLSAGIIYSRLMSSDDRTTFENNSVRSSGYLNSSLLSLQGGIGLQYNFTDRLGIKLEPHYRLFTKGIDRIIYQQTKSFDATLGIIFTLWEKK